MTLHSEIFEQPERLASLLSNQKQTVLEIAGAIQKQTCNMFSSPRASAASQGVCGKIFQAVGVALPPSIREL